MRDGRWEMGNLISHYSYLITHYSYLITHTSLLITNYLFIRATGCHPLAAQILLYVSGSALTAAEKSPP